MERQQLTAFEFGPFKEVLNCSIEGIYLPNWWDEKKFSIGNFAPEG